MLLRARGLGRGMGARGWRLRYAAHRTVQQERCVWVDWGMRKRGEGERWRASVRARAMGKATGVGASRDSVLVGRGLAAPLVIAQTMIIRLKIQEGQPVRNALLPPAGQAVE